MFVLGRGVESVDRIIVFVCLREFNTFHQILRGTDAGCTCCRGKHDHQSEDKRAGGEIELCRELQYVCTREAKGEEEGAKRELISVSSSSKPVMKSSTHYFETNTMLCVIAITRVFCLLVFTILQPVRERQRMFSAESSPYLLRTATRLCCCDMHGMTCRWAVSYLRVELVLGVGPLDMLRIPNLKIFVQDHIPERVRRSMLCEECKT